MKKVIVYDDNNIIKTYKSCSNKMLFTEIPLEVYGIILNYMKNPLKLSEINKELYKLLNESVYGWTPAMHIV